MKASDSMTLLSIMLRSFYHETYVIFLFSLVPPPNKPTADVFELVDNLNRALKRENNKLMRLPRMLLHKVNIPLKERF